MSSFSARRFVTACAISAAAVAALAAPGAASANGPCEGTEITGQGSSLQKLAQVNVWGPAFNTKCFGKASHVHEYNASGSGAGIKSWGASGGAANFEAKNAYVGTDQPPNALQKEEIEKSDTKKEVNAHSTLLSIPVLQAAVPITVHLPAGCTAENEFGTKRLDLKHATVESIFEGKIVEWKQIKDFGDKYLGAGCSIIKPKAKVLFTRVVREDGSGTTATFKKWMYTFHKTKNLPAGPALGEEVGIVTWNELAEANPNTLWPREKAHPVKRAAKGSGVVALVASTENTIGYANLADARVAAFEEAPSGTGGPGTNVFWADVENEPKKVADPATNGEADVKGNANCENTTYTNGAKKFPPPTTEEVWNEVSSTDKEKNYPICGFTYDLSLVDFGEFAGTTPEEIQTVQEYLGYEVGAVGQTEIGTNEDYLGLPEPGGTQDVEKIAQEGAAKIG